MLRQAFAGLESGVILDHLGDVQAARGAQGQAAESWRRALEQDDLTDDQRASVERKLAPPAPQ